MPEHYDRIIRNGAVYDGSGAPPIAADLGIRGDTIARVGAIPADAEASETIDATGHAVSPGFIDVHSHDDTLVFTEPEMFGKSMQGITTVINGNCGSGVVPRAFRRTITGDEGIPDWDSYAGYFDAIEAHPPSVNVATLVGFGALRAAVIGDRADPRPATDSERDQMRTWMRESLEAGCVGLSTGLIYEPDRYASLDEVAAVAEELAPFGAIYASHVRGEGETLLEAHGEAIEIGRRAGVPVQISHHKVSGKRWWGLVSESLAQIERARADGFDVTADQYPYTAGSTRLYAMRQNGWFEPEEGDMEVLLAAVAERPEWEGRSVSDLASEFDLPIDQAVNRILDEAGHGVFAVMFSMAEDDVRTVLKHPTTMIGTDGIGAGSRPHPRLYGTYPRILGRYVRDEGLLSLESAIHKMTGMPAAKFHLEGRGAIEEGAVADLVIFDPATVIDVATYEDPKRAPAGMPWVLVNGEPVVRDGAHTGARVGRPVRFGRR
ncbi:MAG: D-aminoacylase [Chloroflexi bacterium]|nr:D-aminoacylase [Chloroflexota bacterium]MDA1147220.1 D-aminoacylase [Chloroflexota bacterium]